MAVGVIIAFGTRLLLVLLFLPFSALDKALNFRSAVAQARQAAPSRGLAALLVFAGLFVEVFMSAAVLIGVADRLAAAVLAVYCIATALLWKPFWRPGDFWSASDGKARRLFWDFWKNLALAGGFLLLTFGATAQSTSAFLAAPLSSTNPYVVASSPP
jgi:putative oxidoreductase